MILAVPNISEGRDPDLVRRIAETSGDARLLDVHIDPDHNRSVLTYAGPPDALASACVAMTARAIEHLDIHSHQGVHPRYGVVDVLPFVPYEGGEQDAARAADQAAGAIADELGVPVHRYGGDHPSLPELRRSLGDRPGHPTAGVVCVGVRGPLVAFNVDLNGPLDAAQRVAQEMRDLASIRALAFPLSSRDLVQVSMNLTRPEQLGPREAFDRVAELAQPNGLTVEGAEVVGLLPDELGGRTEGLPLRAPARTVAEALRGG